MNKLLLRFSILSFIFFLSAVSLSAQIRQESSISVHKSVNSDDPLRHFHPADIGIPAGDINGDGKQEFINHTFFSPDLSTEELGDVIDKSLVCNFSDTGVREECVIFEGVLLFPAGDLSNDGKDDLLALIEEEVGVYTFPNGEVVPELPEPTLFIDGFETPIDKTIWGNDLDGDGTDDVVVNSVDFNNGHSLCIGFGAENPMDFEVKCGAGEPWFEDNIGSKDFGIGVGDMGGDSAKELVLLTADNSTFPAPFGATYFGIGTNREITKVGESDLGTTSGNASSLRLFIGNADGENNDDLIWSKDRYNTGKGFRQIFFDEPLTNIAQSTGNYTIAQQRAFGIGLDVVSMSYTDVDVIAFAFTNLVTLSICFGVDIFGPNENPGEEACSNMQEVTDVLEEGDQIFINRYSPNNFRGINGPSESPEFINGVLSRDQFAGGRAVTTVDEQISSIVNFTPLRNVFSEIFSTHATNPSPPEIPFGVAHFTEYFPTGFFSVHAETGFRFDFLTEEEKANVSGSEPDVVRAINGFLAASGPGNTSIVGSEGFVVWFNKATVTEDTSNIEQVITYSDFQDLDDSTRFFGINNVGDFNNDGFDDLLIGSKFARLDNDVINKAWLFYGGETFSSMPNITWDFNQDSTIDGFTFAGVGNSIEALGDINGDGIDDFALGLTGVGGTGQVYIYFGEEIAEKGSAKMDYEYPDLILKPRVLAGQSLGNFGSQISAGDFDGDGAKDIAVVADYGSGPPDVPSVQIFLGGENFDGIADIFLSATRANLGGDGDGIISGSYSSSMSFLPLEQEKTHQDILFYTPEYPNAVIFEGGAQADTIPDIQLINPNQEIGFGMYNRSKPAVGDLNDDGFYDIILVNQISDEDAFVSSRAYFFSPNSGIEPVNNEVESINPLQYRLSQNYPNPFNPSTNIEFRLGNSALVTLKVYDILGREVATLIDNQRMNAGSHQSRFDASALASGIYLYKLQAGSFIQTRKMMLIK